MLFKRYFAAALALLCVFAAGCSGLTLPAAPAGPVELSTPAPAPGGITPDETPDGLSTGSAAIGEAYSGKLPQSGGVALGEGDGVTYEEITVFYPEGADGQSALYTLCYTLPRFGGANTFAQAANERMGIFEEELLERVLTELLPYADGEGVAKTRVECAAERVGEYINVYFYEFTSFGGEEELTPTVMVLNGAGERLSLAGAAGVYDVEPLAAQQVFNVIETNPDGYYGDLSMETIASALDIYGGFFATDSGFGLIVAPGALSGEERGALTFVIPSAAFYPSIVGDVLTPAQYEALRGPLNDLIAACAIEYAGFGDSAPGAYIASTFLTWRLLTGGEDALFVAYDKAVYEALFAASFKGPLPADIYSAGDGTYVDGESVMLPVYPQGVYALRIDDGARDGDAVTLYGMIQYGVPGSAESGELSAVAVRLIEDADAACGFYFDAVDFR